MVILAIDPGNAQSGWCIIDRETMKPQDFGKTDNNELLDSFERLIRVYQVDVVVIEMVACYGMPVGREVFETCVWIGRFTEKAISTHTLRGERDSTYCICEVTPPQQSGHFTKNHFKKRYFLHNMYYFFSEPPYKTNITAHSLTKSNCPQDHMFPLHLYAPLSSSNYYPNNRIEGYLVLHQ